MSGWKDWQIGEVVTEGDFQSLVQDQVVQRYADASERTSTLGTAVAEGMVSYLDDTNRVEVYDGTAWTDFSGDITGVTAGTGLSGGGTAGDVTLSADYAAIGSAITVDQDQVTGLTSGTQGYTALSNGTAGITYQPVSHNYIINGAFDIAQRGTAATHSSGYFTADRWYLDGANTTTQVEMTDTDRSEIGVEDYPYYFNYTNGTATPGTFARLEQRIEDVRTLAGKTVTLSYWARKSDPAKEGIRYLQVRQFFGSGGSAAVNAISTLVSTTTSWTRYSYTFTIPSIAGKSIVGTSYLIVQFFGNFNSSFDYDFDIFGVQLEAGSVATPFKRHAPSLQGELAACQRYYKRLDSSSGAFATFGSGQASGNTVGSSVVYYGNMRARPTVTTPDVTKLATSGATFGTLAGTSYVVNAARQSSDGCLFQLNVAAGLVAGNATTLMANNTLDAVIEMNAEL